MHYFLQMLLHSLFIVKLHSGNRGMASQELVVINVKRTEVINHGIESSPVVQLRGDILNIVRMFFLGGRDFYDVM